MNIRFLFAMPLPTALAGIAGDALAGMPAQASDDRLAAAEEMALYISGRNSVGHRACNGLCAASWPSLTATGGNQASGDCSSIPRDGGSRQLCTGTPLYRSVTTRKADEQTGDGANSASHVAAP